LQNQGDFIRRHILSLQGRYPGLFSDRLVQQRCDPVPPSADPVREQSPATGFHNGFGEHAAASRQLHILYDLAWSAGVQSNSQRSTTQLNRPRFAAENNQLLRFDLQIKQVECDLFGSVRATSAGGTWQRCTTCANGVGIRET
jgi:hypothetical protein